MTVVAIGLIIIVIGVTMMGLFARRLARDITDLEATARHLADEEMPAARGAAPPGRAGRGARRGHAAAADKDGGDRPGGGRPHQPAAHGGGAAAGEASLRNGIGQVFVSLARRNQSLLQRQLRLIDALEQKASDPATLADLFPLDHLTTRMRRHAEGLIILSGASPGRSWSEPVPVIDVIRGAVAEVEDYKRVTVLTLAEDAVAGLAAADMIHLLAELIENATLSSPSGTRVEVRAERVANGFAIEIDDRGLGIEAGQLRTINQQLAEPPDFDLANADQLGLFVVGKLAARHGVRVALRPSPYGGTTAVVLMPNSIVVPMGETEADTDPGIRPSAGRAPGLDLRRADALILTGRRTALPRPASEAGEANTAGGSSGTAQSPAAAVLGPIGTPPAPIGTPPGSAGSAPGSAAAARGAGSALGSADTVWGSGGTATGPVGTATGSAGPATGSANDDPASTGPDVADTAVGRVGFSLGSPAPSLDSPPTSPRSPAPGLGSSSSGSGSSVPGPGSPAAGLTSPAPGLGSPAPSLGSPSRGLGSPAPSTDASDSPGLAPAAQAAGTYRGLPRRVRQASLNPHLRDNPSAVRETKSRRYPAIRDPEPGGGAQPRRLLAERLATRPRDRRSGRRIHRCCAVSRGDRTPRPREARRATWMSRARPGQASS